MSISAKAQSITYGSEIAKGVEQVQTNDGGLVNGHSLTDITLNTSTNNATNNGKITPSAATIKDSLGNNVTRNYNITYDTGNLVITAKELTPTVNCDDKDYDGTTDATCRVTLDEREIVGNDSVNASAGNCKFAGKDVLKDDSSVYYQEITCNGASLSGTSAKNYSIP